jgi:hypothetical protein
MRAAVGVEANPWTGGKVALAHKEFSNTAEVSRKVREDSILREILSRGLPSVCCYRYFPSDVGSRSRTRRLSKVSVATGIIPDPASDCWNLTYISFQYFSLSGQPPTPSKTPCMEPLDNRRDQSPASDLLLLLVLALSTSSLPSLISGCDPHTNFPIRLHVFDRLLTV